MSFENTKSSISQLEQSGNISSADVFNVFRDLCEDVEMLENNKLEKLSCSNASEDDLISTFVWCSKKVLRVINKNKEQFNDADNVQMLDKEIAKLTKAIEELEEQKISIEKEFAEKKKSIEELLAAEKTLVQLQENRKGELEEIQSGLEEQKKKRDALEQECTALEQNIQTYQDIDIKKLINDKAELTEKKEQLEKEIKDYESNTQNVGDEIKKLEEEKNSLISSKGLEMGTLTLRKNEVAELEGEWESLKKQIHKLEEEIRNKKKEYEIEKAKLPSLGGERDKILENIQKIRENQAEYNIDVLRTCEAEEQIEFESKKNEYEKEVERLAGEKLKHKKELDNLKESQEKETGENEELKKSIEEIKGLIEILLKEKVTLNKDLSEKSKEKSELEDWFNSVVAKDSEKRLSQLKNQIQMMRQAKNELDKEFSKKCIMNAERVNESLETSLQEYRRYFDETMEQMEKMLCEYSEKYIKVSTAIYEGGR